MAEDAHKGASAGGAGAEPPGTPKLEDLARRIMDLWQEQLAAIAADPDLMRQMARMMAVSPFPAMMQGIMQGILAAQQPHPGAAPGETAGFPFNPPGFPSNPPGFPSNPFDAWRAKNGAGSEGRTSSPGATPAAAASQPGGDDLAELRRNLAGLEARLGELQRGEPGKSRSGEAKSSRKPAARKPAPKVGGAGGGSGGGGSGGAGPGAAG